MVLGPVAYSVATTRVAAAAPILVDPGEFLYPSDDTLPGYNTFPGIYGAEIVTPPVPVDEGGGSIETTISWRKLMRESKVPVADARHGQLPDTPLRPRRSLHDG